MAKKKTKGISLRFKITILSLVSMLLSLSLITGISSYTIDKHMKKQVSKDLMLVMKEIAHGIEADDKALANLEKQFEGKLRFVAQILSETENVSNEYLARVAEKTGVAEINIVDENREIIYSNLDGNLGWIYPEGHPASPLFTGQKKEIMEKVRKSQTDENYYKYGAIALENGGIIQVGIRAEEIKKIEEDYDKQKIIEELSKNENILYAAVIDKDLKVVAHSDIEKIGTELNDEASKIGAVEGKEYSEKIHNEETNSEIIEIVVPLKQNGSLMGALKVGISLEHVKAGVRDIIIKSIYILLASFLIAGLLIILFLGGMIKPLNVLAKFADAVAKGDLSKEISIKKNDEIGMLAKAFNTMSANLKKLVQEVIHSSGDLSESSEQLSATTEELLAQAQNVSATTEEIAAGMEQNNASIEQVTASFEEISRATRQLAKKAEEGNSLAGEIGNRAQKMKSDAVSSQKITNDMYKEKQSQIKKAVEKSRVVTEIENMSNIISGIAEQINLLALNAAIEAARAGEQGRGFAVVAEEVRKLAEESSNTVSKIKPIIDEVQGAVKELAENAEGILGFIDGKISDDYDLLVDTGNQYIEDSQVIGNLVSDFAEAAEQISASMDEINTTVEMISTTIEESAAGSNDIAGSMTEMTIAIQEVAKVAEKQLELTNKLNNMINRFKV